MERRQDQPEPCNTALLDQQNDCRCPICVERDNHMLTLMMCGAMRWYEGVEDEDDGW